MYRSLPWKVGDDYVLFQVLRPEYAYYDEVAVSKSWLVGWFFWLFNKFFHSWANFEGRWFYRLGILKEGDVYPWWSLARLMVKVYDLADNRCQKMSGEFLRELFAK